MVIDSNNKALSNITNSFFYCGIEISKDNFDIKDIAKVCSKINDLKHHLYQEKNLNSLRQNHVIINKVHIYSDLYMFIAIKKEKVFLTLYKNGEIEPLTQKNLIYFTDEVFVIISRQMEIIATQAITGIIPTSNNRPICRIKNNFDIITFINYLQNVEKLSKCYYKTSELEFITGYDEYIYTDEQLRSAIKDR